MSEKEKAASIVKSTRESLGVMRFFPVTEKIFIDTNTGNNWMVGEDKDTNHIESAEIVQDLNKQVFMGGKWRIPSLDEIRRVSMGRRSNMELFSLIGEEAKYWRIWSNELCDEDGEERKEDEADFAFTFSLKLHYANWQRRTKKNNVNRAFFVRQGLSEEDMEALEKQASIVKDIIYGRWKSKTGGA